MDLFCILRAIQNETLKTVATFLELKFSARNTRQLYAIITAKIPASTVFRI
ncbi:hypothetical protein BH160DRAFT_1173 [Burkholderia sp. H160]|nr:hypothetical protein BH160DRAFT_1173 [Burkholderia sp. H160]